MFLGQFFIKNAKMALKHFLNSQNRIKFDNRENVEIQGNSMKNGHCSKSKFSNADLAVYSQAAIMALRMFATYHYTL